MKLPLSLELPWTVRATAMVESGDPAIAFDGDGHGVAVDGFVKELLEEVRTPRSVKGIVRAHAYPATAFAALCALVHSGLVDCEDGALNAAPPPSKRYPAVLPRVTVVIVSYNSERQLPTVLSSLEAQTHAHSQIVVVDNASTDGSREVIRAYDKNVEAVFLERNLGFAAAANMGINRAKNEFVVLLNADVELLPDTLAAWVSAAAAAPRAAAVAAKMLLATNPRFLNGLGGSVPTNGWGTDNFMGVMDLGQFDHLEQVFTACFGAVLLRRSAVDVVGEMDPSYFLYYEDADWCFRARLKGFTIVPAPEARVVHDFGASVREKPTDFKLRLVVRNRLRFALSNLGAGDLARAIGFAAVADSRSVVGALRRGHTSHAWARVAAYGDIAPELPALLRRRRARRGEKVVEPDRALNVDQKIAASAGAYPLLSAAVVRHHYEPLFPLVT